MKAIRKEVYNKNQILKIVEDLPDEFPIICIFKKKRKIRSNYQNRWFWSWMKVLSLTTGYTLQEIHDEMCKMFGPIYERKNLLGEMESVHRTTSTMSTIEFNEFMDRIHVFWLTDWPSKTGEDAIDLPYPDHPNFEQFIFEYSDKDLLEDD